MSAPLSDAVMTVRRGSHAVDSTSRRLIPAQPCGRALTTHASGAGVVKRRAWRSHEAADSGQST
ncbi:MAG: hypothetical protein ACRD0P_27120, partial [Stackebrandtia sp.]